MISKEIQLLRRLCRPTLLASEVDDLQSEINALWDLPIEAEQLIHLAEKHGLSPLVYQHLGKMKIPLDQQIKQQFIALKLRHQKANLARTSALKEILSLFSSHHLEAILLKGAALMHTLYEDISLRPMSDLDILVQPDKARLAQECLRQLGYAIHKNQNPYLSNHHHLPMASKKVENVSIHVEIHTDALSRDVGDSIQFDNLTSDPIALQIDDQIAYRLGHIDSLRHLCHHTLEPVEEIKLIAVADIYGYVSRYIDEIDTELVNKKYPFITNTLTLFHYLSPLPQTITGWIKPPKSAQPDAVGKGLLPLSERHLSDKQGISKIRSLMDAPDWWLHCFYTVSPDRSLFVSRYVKHPLQVLIWILRRAFARYRAS